MGTLLTALLVVAFPLVAFAEDPETIVRRLRDDGGQCHYVLSICSDTARAENSLERIRTEDPGADQAGHAERLARAEARVAKQVDLLHRAAAAVRARRPDEPECFRHCARLQADK